MPGTRLRMKKRHIARLKLAENVRHRIRLCMIHAEISCVLMFSLNKRTKAAYPFCIGNEQLREESTTTCLGILQDINLKSVNRTRASIEKGRNAFHAMRGYGPAVF